ncbi:unnamed protein product [Protopolystoma xenopodis]|uniref:Uncharacterized protein n=1 Tax=Protopolystoma xenopodis TaxID=117903 RepID=A0A448XAM3_9PLAT|nr:unnamed protein product [Protopolystoma xenopodis]
MANSEISPVISHCAGFAQWGLGNVAFLIRYQGILLLGYSIWSPAPTTLTRFFLGSASPL